MDINVTKSASEYLQGIVAGSWEDCAMGMIWAHALGDALGRRYERKNPPAFEPDCSIPFGHVNRFLGPRTSAPAQTTDDNQMALMLLVTLERGYTREEAIRNYVYMVNHCGQTGRKTNELFGGFKSGPRSEATYQKRRAKASAASSQSNGALMRSAQLALVKDRARRQELVTEDCSLTNWDEECVAGERVYIEILASLLEGGEIADAETVITTTAAISDEHQALLLNLARSDWKSTPVNGANRGWHRWALMLSFAALSYTEPLIDFFRDLVQLGGDTDTNMAIAGAVIGARRGALALMREPHFETNITAILNSDWSCSSFIKAGPRTLEYHPSTVTVSRLVDASVKL